VVTPPLAELWVVRSNPVRVKGGSFKRNVEGYSVVGYLTTIARFKFILMVQNRPPGQGEQIGRIFAQWAVVYNG
jgi:hypothetical protein